PAHLRLVIPGGEAMPAAALAAWQASALAGRVRLLNAYGPTEAVVTATLCPVPAAPETVPAAPAQEPFAPVSAAQQPVPAAPEQEPSASEPAAQEPVPAAPEPSAPVSAAQEPVPELPAPPQADSVPPPLGRPLAGRTAYVLDRGLQPLPVGVPGELCLGGRLARGYLRRPDLTAASFVPDPFGA